MLPQNIFIKFFCRQEHFPPFTLGNQWRACKAEEKTHATAMGSAARVASDAIFSGRNFCVTCDPCGTVRDENATLTPRKGGTTNDQNRTTRIRIVARLSPASAVARCLPAVAARRPDRASRAFGLPPPKAAGVKRIYWGQKPRAKALPTYLFFAKRKGKPKETNTMISIFKEVIL